MKGWIALWKEYVLTSLSPKSQYGPNLMPDQNLDLPGAVQKIVWPIKINVMKVKSYDLGKNFPFFPLWNLATIEKHLTNFGGVLANVILVLSPFPWSSRFWLGIGTGHDLGLWLGKYIILVNRTDWKSWWENRVSHLHGWGRLRVYRWLELIIPRQVVTQFKIADTKKFDKIINTEDQLAALGWEYIGSCDLWDHFKDYQGDAEGKGGAQHLH